MSYYLHPGTMTPLHVLKFKPLMRIPALQLRPGTLMQVGVATDTARRIRAEQAMAKYQDVEKLYDQM